MIHLFNTNFSSSSALRLINKVQECVDNIQFVRLFVFHFVNKKSWCNHDHGLRRSLSFVGGELLSRCTDISTCRPSECQVFAFHPKPRHRCSTASESSLSSFLFFFFSFCRRVVSDAIVIAIVRELRQSVNKWDVNRMLVWLPGGSCTWKPCSRFALSVFYFMNYLMA